MMNLSEILSSVVLIQNKPANAYISCRRKVEAFRRSQHLRQPCQTCHGFILTVCKMVLCAKCSFSYREFQHINLEKFYYQQVKNKGWARILEAAAHYNDFIVKGHCEHINPIDRPEEFDACQVKILITRNRKLKKHWDC